MFEFLKTAAQIVVEIARNLVMMPDARPATAERSTSAAASTSVEIKSTKAETSRPAPVACKDCKSLFTPKLRHYRVCPSCFQIWLDKGKQPITAAPTVAAPSTQLPSTKDVMRAWAKEAFEADNLPEGSRIICGKSGKVTLTLGSQCVVFHSNNRPQKTSKPSPQTDRLEPVAIAPATERPSIAEASQSGPTTKWCLNRECPVEFIPERAYFGFCPKCHSVMQAAKLVAQPATRPMSERERQNIFARDVRAAYETGGQLPEGAKVTENAGGQVVISAIGLSATFVSEKLRKQLEAEKKLRDRAAAEQRTKAADEDNTRRALAKQAFEADNLPEGAVVKPAGEGKVTVTYPDGTTTTFSSKKMVQTAEVAQTQLKRGAKSRRDNGRQNGGQQKSRLKRQPRGNSGNPVPRSADTSARRYRRGAHFYERCWARHAHAWRKIFCAGVFGRQ